MIQSETAARFVNTERGSGRPSCCRTATSMRSAFRGSGVIGHRSRRRHEIRGARRAARRHGLRPVAARAKRRLRTWWCGLTGDPMALAPAAGDLVRTLNPALPVPEVRSLADHVAGSIAERRLRALPAAGFATSRAGCRHGRPLRRPGPGDRQSGGRSRPSAPPSARRRAGWSGSSCEARSPLPGWAWRWDCRRRPRPAVVSRPCSTASVPTTRHADGGRRRRRPDRAGRFYDSRAPGRPARPDGRPADGLATTSLGHRDPGPGV